MKLRFSFLASPVPLLKGGYFLQLRDQFLVFSFREKMCIAFYI